MKRRVCFRKIFLWGCLLCCLGLILYNQLVEPGLTGGWFLFGAAIAGGTYFLLLADWIFSLLHFLKRRKTLQKGLWIGMLISKGLFCISAFYGCCNTIFSFSIFGRAVQPQDCYYMMSLWPLLRDQQLESSSVRELLDRYWLLILIPAILFVISTFLEIIADHTERN